MKGLLDPLWILFVIIISGCISTEAETSVAEYTSNLSAADSNETTTQPSTPIILPEGYSILSEYNIAYKINEDLMTWDEARDKCIWDGGDLAIIDTWDKIKYIISNDSDEEYMLHVGFHKPEDFGEWIRVDNESPVAWLPWFRKHPPTKTRYCVVLLPGINGLLNIACWLKAKSICEVHIDEIDQVATNNTSAIIESDLPDGYVQFERFHTAYKIYDDYLTHSEARDRCYTDGGNLAIVDSFEKVRVIAALPKTGSLHVGIRLGSVYFEKWVADSNGKTLEDLPWTPDNPHLKKCAALRNDGSGLEETICSNRLQFICEISNH